MRWIYWLTPLLAGTPDQFLGYTIGQSTKGWTMEQNAQGHFVTTGKVDGVPGKLFIIPCGTQVHEIVYQVKFFPLKAVPDDEFVENSPGAQFVASPAEAAQALGVRFSGALQSAGWVPGLVSEIPGRTMTTLERAGVERVLATSCEKETQGPFKGYDICAVNILAGGDGYCTAGL